MKKTIIAASILFPALCLTSCTTSTYYSPGYSSTYIVSESPRYYYSDYYPVGYSSVDLGVGYGQGGYYSSNYRRGWVGGGWGRVGGWHGGWQGARGGFR